mgnify:CR=1 FL=1
MKGVHFIIKTAELLPSLVENLIFFICTNGNVLAAVGASPGLQTWSWLRSPSAPAATTAPTTATAARPGEQQQQQQ